MVLLSLQSACFADTTCSKFYFHSMFVVSWFPTCHAVTHGTVNTKLYAIAGSIPWPTGWQNNCWESYDADGELLPYRKDNFFPLSSYINDEDDPTLRHIDVGMITLALKLFEPWSSRLGKYWVTWKTIFGDYFELENGNTYFARLSSNNLDLF